MVRPPGLRPVALPCVEVELAIRSSTGPAVVGSFAGACMACCMLLLVFLFVALFEKTLCLVP